MHCGSVYRYIFIDGIVFSCHLSKIDMKPLIGKPCTLGKIFSQIEFF